MNQNCIDREDEKFKMLHDYQEGLQKEYGMIAIVAFGRASNAMARITLKPYTGSESITSQFFIRSKR